MKKGIVIIGGDTGNSIRGLYGYECQITYYRGNIFGPRWEIHPRYFAAIRIAVRQFELKNRDMIANHRTGRGKKPFLQLLDDMGIK